MSSNDRVVCTISSAKKRISTDNVWLLNLEMIEQQTGRIISRHYVEHDELLGSIVQFSVDNVLYSKLRPNLNKVVLPDCDGYATSELVPLKPNSAILCREYLAAYLRSDSFVAWAVSKTTGAKMPRLGTDVLLDKINTNLPLPPLDEQRRIAVVLDKVSDLIAKRRQQLEKLDELVKARFVEMFGDFKTNPMGWPIVPFREIAKIDANMTMDFDKYANYPHIGIENIEKTTGTLRGYKTVAEDNVLSGKYIFTHKHIIYSKLRPNLNKVALPDFDGVCSSDAYPILPFEEKCNRIFLAHNMRSNFFLDYIVKLCGGTNLPRVNRKEILDFQTPLPPVELQSHFATFVGRAEKVKKCANRNLRKLETLKKSLMQRYFE